jgi:hypothetical protein
MLRRELRFIIVGRHAPQPGLAFGEPMTGSSEVSGTP